MATSRGPMSIGTKETRELIMVLARVESNGTLLPTPLTTSLDQGAGTMITPTCQYHSSSGGNIDAP
jgi:hypothetical protein